MITIKPGFVDTPMTALFKKGLLWTKPNIAALKICKSINKDADIVYVPFYWKIIFIIIKLIPEKIFKRIKL